MKSYLPIAVALVVIGAINWGLVGLLNLNLVSMIFGTGTLLEKVIYIIVGLAGVMVAYNEWGTGKKKK